MNDERYIDGSVEAPSLKIYPTEREDSGLYRCMAGNEIGEALSEDSISLDVICKLQLSYIQLNLL